MICSRLAERGVKNTAGGSMWMRRALTCFAPEPQACREGSKNTAGGQVRGPNIFCPRIPKLAERGVKNTAGGFGEG